MKSLIAILCLFSSCAWGSLKFETTVIEADAPLGADKLAVDFHFTNEGEENTIITKIKRDCDCLTIQANGGTTLPKGRKRYRPGEGGIIRAEFDLGNNKGLVEQRVALWLEGDPEDKPSIHLVARIEIPELINLSTKTLKWEVNSKPETKPIDIVLKGETPIHVTDISSTSKDFEIELKTVEEGRHYQLQVTPKSTEIPGIAVIQIDTDSKIKGQKSSQAFAMVHRP